MTGTTTFADAANMQLLVGSTVIGTLVYPGAGEATNPVLGPYVVTVPAGGATISVKTITIGSGTASTFAQINAVPAVVSGSGGGYIPDWESQQPLYAIAIGGTATVSVIDESYGEVA
jgi:hypothetical protein